MYRLIFAIMFVPGCFFEGTALYLGIERDYGMAGSLHAAAALVFVIPAVFLRVPADHAPQFRFLSALTGCLTLFLPLMGIVGCAVTYMAVRWVLKPKGLVGDYALSADYTVRAIPDWCDDEDPRKLVSDELCIEPFLDILSGPDEDMKLGALNMLGRMGTPEAVRLLKRCLTDPSPEVRLQAHSTLAKLDEKYVTGIKEARERVNTGSTDPSRDLFELGKVYTVYAHSGLLEKEIQEHYLNLARSAYEDGFQRSPSDPDVLMELGRLRLETGDIHGAAKCFERGLKDDRTRVQSFLGLCRIFYDRGDLKTVGKLVRRVGSHRKWHAENATDQQLFQFWTDSEWGKQAVLRVGAHGEVSGSKPALGRPASNDIQQSENSSPRTEKTQ